MVNTNETKRNATITATANLSERGDMASASLDLAFSNGETLQLRVGDLDARLIEQAVLHGLKQKLVDAAAISRNTETGRPASVADKFEAVKAVYDRLLAGQWNAVREGGGTTGGLLLRALVRMYAGRKTEADLREFLAGKTDAEKAALRKNPRVAEIIDTIRAESGKDGGIDSDELLAGLED